jgi:hypothetical protein
MKFGVIWPVTPSAAKRGSRGRSSVAAGCPFVFPGSSPPMSAWAAPLSRVLPNR